MEFGKMDKGTFGSVKEYKMLDFLTEMIGNLDKHRREYLSSTISKFNKIIVETNKLTDKSSRCYFLSLIFDDYTRKIDTHMVGKYDEKTITYLKNFIHAKINNVKNK